MVSITSFKTIREWDGSQHRAFEELCYQLRDALPSSAELVKTGNPDAGVEWYVSHSNGTEWGWQAKYIFDINDLLTQMERSLKTVCEKRPNCRRLTFCIPFDLPDGRVGKEQKSAREKFADRKKAWIKRIPGAGRVRVDLWSAGDILERLNTPANAGKAWFFWDEQVFSDEWCRERLRITTEAAGDRYSPELHVDLPVAFSLEGLARTSHYWDQYRRRRVAVLRAAGRITTGGYTGLGVTQALRTLRGRLVNWTAHVAPEFTPAASFDRDALLMRCSELTEALNDAYPTSAAQSEGQTREESGRRDALAYHLSQLSSALHEFVDFLRSPAAVAAERRALVMTGNAGQGKTHLLCDTGSRLLDQGQPAAVLLANRMSGRNAWNDISQQLGLGSFSSSKLIQAMQAAGEASNKPFVLLIDALNEAADPAGWRPELPGLLAEARQSPWLAIGVSLRSSYEPVVLPPDNSFEERIARVDHPGFADREVEAVERFFAAFGLEQPRAPFLTPEFTNPLFLKLYCEGLKAEGLSAPPAGHVRLTAVFAQYLEWKSKRIASMLGLDPQGQVVRSAVNDFAERLAREGRERLQRSDAKQIVDVRAPGRPQYQDTLFAALVSEGVLAQDVAWDQSAADYVQVVRFSYQRLTDHLVVGALLASISDAADLHQALRKGQSLRRRLLAAPIGWIEAISIQLPERFGVELLDASNWRLDFADRHGWMEALIASVPLRTPESITDRTRELLDNAARTSPSLDEQLLEAIITVAPQPDHPLNANRLHRWLVNLTLARRDASWSRATYRIFGDRTALDRLIRWSANGPYPSYPDEVVELSATPVVWMLTSPNRFVRDYVTKTLTQLLAPRLKVLFALLERFARVNDPYVRERLAVITHGALLLGGSTNQQTGLAIARRLKEIYLDHEEIPNLLTRDAVRGAYEWCLREGLLDDAEYRTVLPPYSADRPFNPRTKEHFKSRYDLGNYDETPDGRRASAYATIFYSIFDMGDFGRYVVESDVRHFSRHPLTTNPSSLTRSRDPRRRADEQYPIERAQRWVFQRTLALGWTPELFGDFDRNLGRHRIGREGHKAERFGKKYQWIALRELLARLSDNYHMSEDFGEQQTYAGPWQFLERDIDPTLPPARRVRTDDDVEQVGPTFDLEPRDSWWCPTGPRFSIDDVVPKDWGTTDADLLEFDGLVRKKDHDGKWWIVLQAYYNWDEEPPEGKDRFQIQARDLWSHIYTWLVRKVDTKTLVDYLGERSLMNQWMPSSSDVIDAGYLAEMPWAAAANAYPNIWQEVERRYGDDEAPGVAVYPGCVEYRWEGNILDCSISDGVSARMPAQALFEAGDLRWRPGTTEWESSQGQMVAQYREARGHSALLVDGGWLDRQLRRNGWDLIVGWLGEKQLRSGGMTPGLIGGWSEINGIASLCDEVWKFGPRRVECKSPVDPDSA